MGRRAIFTEADLRRVMKVARENDPRAIVEVTSSGTIRIVPESASTTRSDVDDWFKHND
ncbi:hypothetical protein PY32053_00740 [Paracoccus yeei]|uniref:Uncharacterized protein n=1 Tax=Paracoccus yeei TaxID=147645 RepID=A0A386UIA5_9RHOB|nr:hypothetical protein [Paracoccus yeei]AYF00415.1 hypothetical protein PY32053_00740 [Paracoccus yeei]AZV00419.1 hypothetical protein pyei1_p02 [Paracoccus phage vB_PyeM_Pyei1]